MHPRDMLPGTAFLHLLPHPSSTSSLSCPPTPDPHSHLPLSFPWPAGPRSNGFKLPTALLVPVTPAGRAGAGKGLGPWLRPPISLMPQWHQSSWPLAPGARAEQLLERRSSAGGLGGGGCIPHLWKMLKQAALGPCWAPAAQPKSRPWFLSSNPWLLVAFPAESF